MTIKMCAKDVNSKAEIKVTKGISLKVFIILHND